MVMAFIYAIVGEYELAIDELDLLLSIPSLCTTTYVRAEPIFAPLRKLPRFKELLAKYETAHEG